MADTKISALSAAGALAGTEVAPIVQSAATVKATVQAIANTASSLAASVITSGTIATARLGSGSSITTKYLRGDQTWSAIAQSEVTSLVSDLALKAPLASPTFTGTVTVPTPSVGTAAATKDYVDSVVSGTSSAPWIFAVDYGVVPDGATNNDTAMANAIAAAGFLQNSTLVLPSGIIQVPGGVEEAIERLNVVGTYVPYVGSGSLDTNNGTIIQTTTLGLWCWQHYNSTFATNNNYNGPIFTGVAFMGATQNVTVNAAQANTNVTTFTGSQTLNLTSATLSGGSTVPIPDNQVITGRSVTTDPVLYVTLTGLTGGVANKAVLSYTGIVGTVLQGVTYISGDGTTAGASTTARFSTAGGLSIEAANGVVENCQAGEFIAGIGFRNGTPVGSGAGGDVAWCTWNNLKALNCAIAFDLGRQEVGNSNAAGDYYSLTTLDNSAGLIAQAGVGVLIRANAGGFINMWGGKDENKWYGILHRGALGDVITDRKSEACNVALSMVRPSNPGYSSRHRVSMTITKISGGTTTVEIGANNSLDEFTYKGTGITVNDSSAGSLIISDANNSIFRGAASDSIASYVNTTGGTLVTRTFSGTGVLLDTIGAGKQMLFKTGEATSNEAFKITDSAGARILGVNSNGCVGFGNTGGPSYRAHIRGGNSTINALAIDTSTFMAADIGNTASVTNGVTVSVFKGATNTYLVFRSNDGAANYLYIQLNGTGTTWVHSGTAPT